MPKKRKIHSFPPPVLVSSLPEEWKSLSEECPPPESSFFAGSAMNSLLSWVEKGNVSGLPVLGRAIKEFGHEMETFDLEMARMMCLSGLCDKRKAFEFCLKNGFEPSSKSVSGDAGRRLSVLSNASSGNFDAALVGLSNYPQDAPSWEKEVLYEASDDARCIELPSPWEKVGFSLGLVRALREPHLDALLAKGVPPDDGKLGALSKNYRRVMEEGLCPENAAWIALSMLEVGSHVLRGRRPSSALKASLWFRMSEDLGHIQASVYLSDALSKLSTGVDFWEFVLSKGVSSYDERTFASLMLSLAESTEKVPSDEVWSRAKVQLLCRLATMFSVVDAGKALDLLDLAMKIKLKEMPIDLANAERVFRKSVPDGTVLVLNDFPDGPDKELPRYERLKLPIRLTKVSALDGLEKSLRDEFPWMSSVTERVMSSLHLMKYVGRGFVHFPPMLLVGSPGIGKTRYCSRLAELCGIPFRVMPSSRSQDAHIMSGMSRGWKDAQPSLLTQWLANELVGNPLVVLDELDKAAEKGQIGDALYLLLEPSTARKYPDSFLGVPCDFGWVNWMATANSLVHLPSVLKSRFTIFEVQDPSPEHYPVLLRRALSDLAERLRIPVSQLPPLSDEELSLLRPFFTTPRAAISALSDLMGRLAISKNRMH